MRRVVLPHHFIEFLKVSSMIGQIEISQWLNQLAQYLPFGYAFGAGMVSAVNPCGFAMLPVYLSLYVGAEDAAFRQRSMLLRMLKACWIALLVTCGFGVLFGLVGVVVSAGGSFLMPIMPWLAVVIGVVLMLAGIWMLLGHHFSISFFSSFAARIGDPRQMTVTGFFLFGLAFGATSLSCTLPIFLMVVGGSVAAGSFLDGVLQFVSFIAGMGAVMLTLTLGIALVKEGVVVGVLRKMLPYVQKVSAVLLLVAGGYITYYWLSSGLLLNR
jgi:cytochrome c-type biogenesis protein